jgi:hypothetical protein
MDIATAVGTDEVLIRFIPKDAAIHFGDTFERKVARSINMRLALDSGEDVRLPDDRTLKQSQWSLYLTEGSTYNDWVTKQRAIGLIHSSVDRGSDTPLPAECWINAALKAEDFSTLLAALQTGRLPSKVHIQVLGMKYGWEPDGEGKVWDLKAMPAAPVTELKFDVPLVAPNDTSSASEDPQTDNLPATSNDIRSLERRLTECLASVQRDISKRWAALFLLLVVALVLFYLRK